MTTEDALRLLSVVKTALECAILAFALFSMFQAQRDKENARETLERTRAVVETILETPCGVPALTK